MAEAISLTSSVGHVSKQQSISKTPHVEESHLGVFDKSAIEIVRFAIRAAPSQHLNPIAYKFDKYRLPSPDKPRGHESLTSD